MQLYRKEEQVAPVGPTLYRNANTQESWIPKQVQKTQTHGHQNGNPARQLKGSVTSDMENAIETAVDHLIESSVTPRDLSINEAISDIGSISCDEINPCSDVNKGHKKTDVLRSKNQIEKFIQPKTSTELLQETGKEESQEFDKDEIGESFEDGWDDDFDDISESFDETFGEQKSPPEKIKEGQKGLIKSSDDVVDEISISKTMDPHCGLKYDPESDIRETRKRWVNPRPNRPYLNF